MKYDYFSNIKNDIKTYLEDNYNGKTAFTDEEREDLYNDLWIEDSVTGNASGSYTFCTYTAEEYICHNLDLLVEVCEEFGQDLGEAFKEGPEFCDVTIRCYLLGSALDEVLEEIVDGVLV